MKRDLHIWPVLQMWISKFADKKPANNEGCLLRFYYEVGHGWLKHIVVERAQDFVTAIPNVQLYNMIEGINKSENVFWGFPRYFRPNKTQNRPYSLHYIETYS